MSKEITLPNIGEGVDEADVAEILVSEGDVVEAQQIIMELETEKAVVELPCPEAGTIEKLLVSAGDTIQVGQPILKLAGAGAASAAPKAETEPAQEKAPEPEAPAKPPASEPAAPTTEMVTGTVEFKLPNLGEGVDSADVADVLISEGDVVSEGDILMELETEKAVVELPSEYAGKVVKLHVGAGDTIEVGQVVATFEASQPVSGDAAPADKPSPQAPAAETKTEEPKPSSTPPKAAAPAVAAKTSDDNGIPVPAAPSTRRMARQLGVDLSQVSGSGRGGRIIADDVQAFVRQQMEGKQIAKRPVDSGVSGGVLAPPPLPDFSKYGMVEREKLNKIGRTAAENLTVSWNVIPHVTQHDRVDITDLEAARKKFTKGIGQNGPKVTMTAIVMKALTKCLQAFPKFNSSLDPETYEIVYKRYYNIGCAVDTPNGLVVPVVKDCDEKSILEIAADITDLAGLARDRKLPIDSMQGATCTVTNLGGIGGVAFTPIVNYPEVCILGMCRSQKELQLVDGQVVERLMMPVSLSYDHRVINGADAARFVVTLSNMLADPFQLLTTV